jgi:signal transduction histidine kinase
LSEQRRGCRPHAYKLLRAEAGSLASRKTTDGTPVRGARQPGNGAARRAVRLGFSARYKKLKALYRISDLINSTSNSATLLKRILAEAVREMNADSGTISFVDEETQTLVIDVAVGIDAARAQQMRLRLGQGVTGAAAAAAKPVRVSDVSASPHYIELKPGVQSELAVPLKVEGRVIGVLNVDSTRADAFSLDDERLLVALAGQAAKVIHTSRLRDSLARQARRLEGLFEVGQALISPDPLPDVLNRITKAVQEIMEVKLCSVMLLSDQRELVLSAVAGGGRNYTQRPNLSVRDSLVGEVVARREPLQVLDVRKADTYRARDMAKRERLASLLAVPVFFHDRMIGILNIYTARPRRFEEEDIRLLNAFASLCGIAIENAQRYERVLSAEHSIRHNDRLATLGILSAEIAHEIRNPVTIITMLVHSLREDHAISPNREKDVDIILDKLERINRIVSQVLGISKKPAQPVEWVSMNTVIEDLLFLVNHALAARQIMVQRQFDAGIPPVLGDRGHFDQVFLNLLLNALEAMPTGGLLTIRTEVASEGEGEVAADGVLVTIRDTGTGIPDEIMPQLFSPFVTARKEGIGLGLFVSRKLLALHDGTITVKSTPGRGTTFKVRIPLSGAAR